VATTRDLSTVGCVAIGRNEGERLRICLQSLLRSVEHVVYVDSGSTDDSVAMAKALGVHVVNLDLSIPFTAARARNVGYQHLLQQVPGIQLIQFVDGDCEVVTGWLERAVARLSERPEVAVVCGRRRERSPHASVYNRMCDLEWDSPVGDVRECGGDAMMRASALLEVGGYNPDLIAGEEPELCVRLRARGHIIERLDAEMTLHDAAMTRAAQWWKRNVRSGYAYAEGVALHGAPPERHWVREYRRALFWSAGVPALALGAALPTAGASLLLFFSYPLSAARVYRHMRSRQKSPEDARVAAVLLTVGKFAELQGILKYHLARLSGQRSSIIEYKDT
jgi:glycosyltransferase involved in cell wall biosynthesis